MNILVLPPFNEAQRAVIEAAATGASFTYASSAEATDEAIAAESLGRGTRESVVCAVAAEKQGAADVAAIAG